VSGGASCHPYGRQPWASSRPVGAPARPCGALSAGVGAVAPGAPLGPDQAAADGTAHGRGDGAPQDCGGLASHVDHSSPVTLTRRNQAKLGCARDTRRGQRGRMLRERGYPTPWGRGRRARATQRDRRTLDRVRVPCRRKSNQLCPARLRLGDAFLQGAHAKG